MNYGSQTVAADAGSQVRIRASGSFIVYAVGESGQRLRILGPNNAQKRAMVCIVPACKELEIETDESTAWEIEAKEVPERREHLDQTPVEIPVGVIRPESLESIMARMINERFSLMAEEKGMETFEEADDFDIDDELPKTPYEMTELDPEEPFYPDAEKEYNKGVPTKEDVESGNVERQAQSTDNERHASPGVGDQGTSGAGPSQAKGIEAPIGNTEVP